MEVIYQVKGEPKRTIKCPDYRNKQGCPDFLAIRNYIKSLGMNHQGQLRVA